MTTRSEASLLLQGGTVVTMDQERRIIDDAAIAIQGERIAAIGKVSEIASQWRSGTVINTNGHLVIPGLIDGHNHPGQYLSRGLCDDVGIVECLYGRLYPYEAACEEDDVYVGALANFVEMVSSGTTCFVDPGGYHVGATIRAANEIGIRGIVSRSTRDMYDDVFVVPPSLRETTSEAVEQSIALVDEVVKLGSSRIRAWLSLRVPYNVSDSLCTQIRDLAADYGIGIHSHVCAQDGENEASIDRWGMRVMERLRRLDLLRPNLYLVHMGWVTSEEMDMVASRGVKVAHCPTASMHGAYGNISRGTIPQMLALGVPIALGTDSVTAGRTLDMFRVMYAAACAHKDVLLDPLVMGAQKALEMATITGAKAAMWDSDIGSLEVGKQADLAIIDTSSINWHPIGDPIRTLVYSGYGQAVQTVVIGGTVVMRDREFPGLDVAGLTKEVETRSQAVLERAGLRIAPSWPRH